jgi:RES domain-containing protein
LKVYRIAKQKFLTDLSGEGSRLFGGRWNKRGFNMLYTSSSLSLSTLELLVHIDYQFINDDFGYIEIEVPDKAVISKVKTSILKQDWRHNPPLSFTQDYGTNWLQQNKSLVLQVPSAVLPTEFNFLLNPNHDAFSEIIILRKGKLQLDSRIFK